jgi:urease accessory protein
MNLKDAKAQREESRDRISELTKADRLHVHSENSVILSSSASPRLCGENQFLLWQLADSAFPTGGFAHSAGLEAAWQHGEVRNRNELREWLVVSMNQVSRAALPFVNAAHAEPERLEELDRLCDAFTSNHVANRASRLQGRALLVAVERIFPERSLESAPPLNGHHRLKRPEDRSPSQPFAHLSPVFGMVTSSLGIAHDEAIRLFVFMHLRSAIAAAVRLNIVGPMEGQAIQFQLSGQAESVAQRGASLTLDDLALTAPLLDLWQGAQDRLYSRLFQS